MRPVTRGVSPRVRDFEDYREAFPYLLARLGPYCSYCERRIATNLAVEHIQPKGLASYEHLAGRWDNFLLACINCNSTKGDKDTILAEIYLPDRDNTAAAFVYSPDGKVLPEPSLPIPKRQMAAATLALTGLHRGPSFVQDENGRIVAIDRYSQRMEVWLIAQSSLEDLAGNPTDALRRQIVRTAQGHGFFSVWMQVFEADQLMRNLFVNGFTVGDTFHGFAGTALDCFDDAAAPISPRPANALAGSSKI